ncbi:MAG: hypothetical protein AW09_003485 [Candidatus Accumulibacter phosphatis]|uniref:Uncharacterized protein n=1 Tax=Candidatus Accumulibacter phosphatis TaxID=327160 RepID=A0A080M2H8_9PROT|nr:MAG: hypothetical protein AW09_003485 [Candidatus Accumulibacter phosphatis]
MADAFQLLHLAGDHPGGGELEKVDRQGEQVAESPAGHMHVDLVGRRQQQYLAQIAEGRIEQHGNDHPGGEHHQGRCILVYQHLVDHYLEEQG